MISLKIIGIILAAFMAGAFVASPELRAYAANTVFSADIVDGQVKTADLGANAVTSPKIKDGEVKVADIAPDSVGASELIGVSKLIFAECFRQDPLLREPGDWYNFSCPVPGAAQGDNVIISRSTKENCYDINGAYATGGEVHVKGRNDCHVPAALGNSTFSIIVFRQ